MSVSAVTAAQLAASVATEVAAVSTQVAALSAAAFWQASTIGVTAETASLPMQRLAATAVLDLKLVGQVAVLQAARGTQPLKVKALPAVLQATAAVPTCVSRLQVTAPSPVLVVPVSLVMVYPAWTPGAVQVSSSQHVARSGLTPGLAPPSSVSLRPSKSQVAP